MTTTGVQSDLPTELEEEIDINLNNDLRRDEVLSVFVKADRPYLERKHVEERLEGGYSRDTVLSRLDNLVDAGVLESDKTGGSNQYWISNDHSRWPIPDDVEVLSDDDPEAITLNDFLNDGYVLKFSLGALFAIVGGVTVSTGILAIGYVSSSGILYSAVSVIAAVALLINIIGFGVMIGVVGQALMADEPNLMAKLLPVG